MLGNFINFIAIFAGAILGLLVKNKFTENISTTVMQMLGLSVVLIGLTMAFKTENALILIGSLTMGAILGEILDINRQLERLGLFLENKMPGKNNNFAKGFVTGTLVYCIGAMAIMGALEAGLQGKYDILLVKSMLDGISAIVFTATMGFGVAFSAFSVLIYQGAITLLANWISVFLTEDMIRELSACGGLLIVAIGLNILDVMKKQIRVANALPALAFVIIIIECIKLFA